MSILTDGDLESGLVVLSGLAERTTVQAFDGTHSLLLRTRKGFSPGTSSAEWPSFVQTPGDMYTVQFRYDGDGSLTAPLLIFVDTGSGLFVQHGSIAAPGAGAWTLSMPITWEATGVTGRIVMGSGNAIPSIANDVWYVDAVTVELATAAAVAKWEAAQALIAALKGINGTGYWHDLDDAVYLNDLDPDRSPEIKRPFVCVFEDPSTFGDFETVIDETLHMIVVGYVEESHAISRDSTGYEAVCKLHDDLIKAIRSNPTMGGTVKILELEGTDTPPGLGNYRAVQVNVGLTLMYSVASLGP